MPKVYLQLMTKNGSLYGDRIEFESEVIPRAGEIIDGHDVLPGEGVRDFIVQSVIYRLTKKGFEAYITAKQWWKGLRQELLEERGWLPARIDHLSYDEDDPARNEVLK